MDSRYKAIWLRAEPYLHTRSNDTHTLYCYYFVRQLLKIHMEADESIVIPAMLLHDVGWSTVPEDKQLQSFGPKMIYPELRRQHEVEGAKIAENILRDMNYNSDKISEIRLIIDGHDTRIESLSINDSLVKDADKLWRYTPFGLETNRIWFGYSVDEQMALLQTWIDTRFYTDAGQHMAQGLYAHLEILGNLS